MLVIYPYKTIFFTFLFSYCNNVYPKYCQYYKKDHDQRTQRLYVLELLQTNWVY